MKRYLLLGIAVFAGFSAQALTSPYTGSQAGEGIYYLYQVETGQWLQSNRSDFNQWTTFATLDDVGFDIELRKPEGFEGYQIFCNFTNNGSLNGANEDRFFLDQPDRDVTDWIFEPVTVDGVTNAYKIMAKATPEGTADRSKIQADFYIGANDGSLSDQPTEMTWQLVSREERLNRMVADAANGPVDATWLIPWNDRGRNDLRDNLWDRNEVNVNGGAMGVSGDDAKGYPIQEYWHRVTLRNSITLSGLPSGTYAFSVQAFYRDTEIESLDLVQRYIDGTENLRATYFAGATTGIVKSIFADAKNEQGDGYSYNVADVSKWVPNNMYDAAVAMFNGAYINEYIKAPVTDGKLTIGIEKSSADHRDWLIVKRFFLQYVSTEVMAEDLSGLQSQIADLLVKAESLPQTPTLVAVITEAKSAKENAKTSVALLEAISALKSAVDVVEQSKDIIIAFNETKVITDAMGVDSSDAVAKFNTATTKGNYEDAIKSLRYARRIHVADRQEDIFAGQQPAPGKFYLYNVGRGQFLCGGSDWGAHAALGIPGVEIELQDAGIGGTGLQKYYIETGLVNGDNHWLNYRGYMDAPQVDGFAFVPVEGKENVFNIVQGDYPDVHMAWNPDAPTDRGNNDETTVGTECRNLDLADLNAQWKLVTREERAALIAKASLKNPVDLTFMIVSPNFNQRERADIIWNTGDRFAVWEYGANHYDFACESYDTPAGADMSQPIAGLPIGIYKVSAQGFYRNGLFVDQPNNEPLQNAVLFAGDNEEDDALLPNILSESGNAPGEGNNATSEAGVTYNTPDGIVQATNFFKSGLYKVYTVIEKSNDNDLSIGVIKNDKGLDGDWIVIDNFRLTYYGADTTKDAVKNELSSGIEDIVIDTPARPEDNRIFNLQGIQVTNPTVPGIYIQNGKKFIVR